MSANLPIYIAEISALLEKQMWVKGRDLKAQTRKAGRRLPRKVRTDLRYLIETAKINDNPKLGRMIDDAKVTKAHRRIVAHLQSLNPREAFWSKVLNITASVSLALIVVFVLLLFVLVQRGFV